MRNRSATICKVASRMHVHMSAWERALMYLFNRIFLEHLHCPLSHAGNMKVKQMQYLIGT